MLHSLVNITLSSQNSMFRVMSFLLKLLTQVPFRRTPGGKTQYTVIIFPGHKIRTSVFREQDWQRPLDNGTHLWENNLFVAYLSIYLRTSVSIEKERERESSILVGLTLSLSMDSHAHLSSPYVCVIIAVLDFSPCQSHSLMLVCPSSQAEASENT